MINKLHGGSIGGMACLIKLVFPECCLDSEVNHGNNV